MATTTVGGLVTLALLAAIGACGGDVTVYDSPGGGGTSASSSSGTGAASSSGTTGTSSSSGTTSTSSSGTTTTTTSPGLCPGACDLVMPCLAASTDCVQACENAACPTARDAWLGCLVANGSSDYCGWAPTCTGALQTWLACEAPWIVDENGGCWAGSDGSCGCQAAEYETECFQSGPSATCTCLRNGYGVAKCSQPGKAYDACEVLDGCCSAPFFVPLD